MSKMDVSLSRVIASEARQSGTSDAGLVPAYDSMQRTGIGVMLCSL